MIGQPATMPMPLTVPPPADASVAFLIGGVWYTAVCPVAPSSDAWAGADDGGTEWRHHVAPSTTAGAFLPALLVTFDVRQFPGGYRIMGAVGNCKNVSACQDVTYDVIVRVGGQVVYSKAGLVHWVMTRWFFEGAIGTVPPEQYDYAALADMLPTYLDDLGPWLNNSLGLSGDPLMRYGDSSVGMGSTGGRAELGPFPNAAPHAARGNSAAAEWCKKFALNGSGCWKIHLDEIDNSIRTMELTGTLFWFDPRGAAGHRPNPNYVSASPFGADFEHQPNRSMYYALTKRRHAWDELHHWCNWIVGKCYSTFNGKRTLKTTGAVRGIAWGLRDLGVCWHLAPTQALRDYFKGFLDANADWIASEVAVSAGKVALPFMAVFDNNAPNPYHGEYILNQNFGTNYLLWSIRHLKNVYGYQHAGLDDFAAKWAAYILTYFSEHPGWRRDWAGIDYPNTGQRANGGTTGPWVYYTDHASLFKAYYGGTPESPGGETMVPTVRTPIPPHVAPFHGYYGTDYRLTLLAARAMGLPGAQDALDYLEITLGFDVRKEGARWCLDGGTC